MQSTLLFLYAGTIYLEKFGDSKLEEAGECFTRARSYDRAAFAYVKGMLYSNCIQQARITE